MACNSDTELHMLAQTCLYVKDNLPDMMKNNSLLFKNVSVVFFLHKELLFFIIVSLYIESTFYISLFESISMSTCVSTLLSEGQEEEYRRIYNQF